MRVGVLGVLLDVLLIASRVSSTAVGTLAYLAGADIQDLRPKRSPLRHLIPLWPLRDFCSEGS